MFTKSDIEKYFLAEKQGGMVFLVFGLLAVLAAAILFLFTNTNVYKGAAFPLAGFGILMALVGFSVYKRSDSDRVRNVYAYDMNPAALKQQELPRMKKVLKNFVILRYTWILFFLVGAALYICTIRDFRYDFWRGFGVGLTVMAFVALVADRFAESRAMKYSTGLASFVSKS